MNYYNDIKNELLNNEINRKVKTYSINKSDLSTYYNVGKMLSEAGKHYGEGIIKEYSKKLTIKKKKKYSTTTLKYSASGDFTTCFISAIMPIGYKSVKFGLSTETSF